MRIKYLPQDNEARINNGICRYKGIPYHISLLSQTEMQLQPLWSKPNTEPFKVNVTDNDVDISSPPLGWLNEKNNAVYLVRRPERNYKQALRTNQISCYFASGADLGSTYAQRVIFTKNGEDMFLGIYPSYTDAVRRLAPASKTSSVAISRNVCLVRNETKDSQIDVYYKLEKVGELDAVKNIVRIPKAELAWIASKYLEGFNWIVE